jgi:TolB-like protein
MPTVEIEASAVRQQLEKVLEGPGFARNDRLSGFLRFLVERYLEGRSDELKESVVGIEVFGRKPDYNPKRDATVRIEAGRLRARLTEYYAGDGRQDPLIIDLPKGGYVPMIRSSLTGNSGARPRYRIAIAGFAALIVAAALIAGWIHYKSLPVPIAVLPLENISHDPADDYLADGLTDELIRNLSIIDGLAPRSQTSSFAFKGRPRNVREVGRELAADYILEGSVLRAGQHLRIDVQLVRARDDSPIWSGRYNRELTDILAIQDEIALGIVNRLRLKLSRGRRRYETSAEAYDLYLRARATYPRYPVLEQVAEAVGVYRRVIAKDPTFAPAYADLAAAYGAATIVPNAGRDDSLARMRAAAERAIQLDPLLAEAHDAMGAADARDGQWVRSEGSFRHAIDLDPNSSAVRDDFAMLLLMPLGRIDEAIQQLRIAERSDPLSHQVQEAFGDVLLSAGRYEEADGHCERASGLDRVDCLGRVRIGQGRFDEAIQILAAARNTAFLGFAYGRAGRRADAEKLAAVSPGSLQQVLVHAGLGDRNGTFQALDRMTDLGPVRVGRALNFPELAFLRGDPHLKALRRKVGLPDE